LKSSRYSGNNRGEDGCIISKGDRLHLKGFYPETFDKEIKMDNQNKPNVALITSILNKETGIGEMFVVNFLQIIEPLCGKIFLITGNFFSRADGRVHIINIKYRNSAKIRPIWIRIPRFILTQLRLSASLIRVSMNVNIVIFYLGGENNLLPMLCSKLLRKKTITFYLGGRKTYEMKLTDLSGVGRIIFPRVAKVLQRIVFFLTDQIVVEAKNILDWAGLTRYRDKTSIGGARYVDVNLFTIKGEHDKRKLVGSIGRLSPEKGISNFTKAIPLILKENDDLEFFIGGEGPLFNEIKNELKTNGAYDKVVLAGWIPHDELPRYLNELKLFVLSSYTEGLPTGVLEAMACGTPVLATSVGGVPDVIKDGETGFIMKDNSPECIAENIKRALNHPDLDRIVKNARELVEKEYTYEAAVERYRKILENLGVKNHE
jgi:glycosyltransferase involved in cell wall biosynthesis